MIHFNDVFKALRSGDAELEASEKLAEVAAKVQECGKPGSFTLTINIKPAGSGRVMISESTKANAPELAKPDNMFFVTESGALSRTNPYQTRLTDLDPKDK